MTAADRRVAVLVVLVVGGLIALGMVLHRQNVHDKYDVPAPTKIWCGDKAGDSVKNRSLEFDPRRSTLDDAALACRTAIAGY